jgi:hypothetical protein
MPHGRKKTGRYIWMLRLEDLATEVGVDQP